MPDQQPQHPIQRIRLSVEHLGEFSVASGTTIHQLRCRLEEGYGLSSSALAELYCEGKKLLDDTPVGLEPLSTGAHISLSPPRSENIDARIFEETHLHLHHENADDSSCELHLQQLESIETIEGIGFTRSGRIRATSRLFRAFALISSVFSSSSQATSSFPRRRVVSVLYSPRARTSFLRIALRRARAIALTALFHSVGIKPTDGFRITFSDFRGTTHIDVRGALPKGFRGDGLHDGSRHASTPDASAIPSRHLASAPRATPEKSSSSKSQSIRPMIITIAISLAVTGLLAYVLRQPTLMAFAIMGPIITLSHALTSRSGTPVQKIPLWAQEVTSPLCIHNLGLSLYLDKQEILPIDLSAYQARSDRHAPVDSESQIIINSLIASRQSAENQPVSVPSTWAWARWLYPFVHILQSGVELTHTLSGFTAHGNQHGHSSPGRAGERNLDAVSHDIATPTCAHCTNSSVRSHPAALLEHVVRRAAQYCNRDARAAGVPATASQPHLLATTESGNEWGNHLGSTFSLPLGRTSSSEVWIDLAKDGPHLLVAGTTGSGKSEFVLSMLTNAGFLYSPEELNVVLVDYKGGAGLGRASELPHTIGFVTDLDPSETERCLAGLSQEITRREHVLWQSGVHDIDAYNASHPHSILPRLLIVVDEFRALQTTHPDFIDGLVRLSAQGRSLGMHLVLATQRPQGSISSEMRANITARVCLRVASEQESLDVIDVKDAAYVSTSTPGRFILRLGSQAPVTAQSFYFAAAGASDNLVWELSPAHNRANPLHIERRQAKPLAATLKERALQLGLPTPQRLWAPALPRSLELKALTPLLESALALSARHTSTVLEPYRWDGTTNLIVYGTAQRGKSWAIHQLSRSRRVAGAQVIVIGQETPNSQHQIGVGSLYCQYVDPENAFLIHATLTYVAGMLHEDHDESTRPIALLIDDLDVTRELLETYDRGSGLALLEKILRDGPRSQISTAATSSKVLPTSISSRFATRLILSSGNLDTDTAFGVPRKLCPIQPVLGRGVLISAQETMHLQLPTSLEQDNPAHANTSSSLENDCSTASDKCLPGRFMSLKDLSAPRNHTIYVGYQGQESSLPLQASALIAGPRKSGKTTALRVLADAWKQHKWVDCSGSEETIRCGIEDYRAAITACADLGNGETPALILDNLDLASATLTMLLEEALTLALSSGGCVYASCQESNLAQTYRGPLAQIKSHRTGFLLQPDARNSREFLDTPITTSIDPAQFLGRCVAVVDGAAYPARFIA